MNLNISRTFSVCSTSNSLNIMQSLFYLLARLSSSPHPYLLDLCRANAYQGWKILRILFTSFSSETEFLCHFLNRSHCWQCVFYRLRTFLYCTCECIEFDEPNRHSGIIRGWHLQRNENLSPYNDDDNDAMPFGHHHFFSSRMLQQWT